MKNSETFVKYEIIEEVWLGGWPIGSLDNKAKIYVMFRDREAKYCPHIHVCAQDPSGKKNGMTFARKKHYKILFSVKLKPGNAVYTMKNIEFHKVWIPHRTILQKTVEWLNDWEIKGVERNCDHAMRAYIDANGYGKQKPELYKKWLAKVSADKAYKFLKSDFVFENADFSPIEKYKNSDSNERIISNKFTDIMARYLYWQGNLIDAQCTSKHSCISHIFKMILWFDHIDLDEWCEPLSQCLLEMCKYKDEDGRFLDQHFIKYYFFDSYTEFKDEFEYLIRTTKEDYENQKDAAGNIYPQARQFDTDKLWRNWRLFEKNLLRLMTLPDLSDKERALSPSNLKSLMKKYFHGSRIT